ncbi:membrane-binding protein [Hymenobacter nivis]|uniref:Membrane-binding protein n=1 Tax=Hymenobacter nivis TaxID=1850093 RepID=A0A2Z3GLQ0_9BACT|nr:membrane-binding protein [Hymenobacter nivis]AWM32657.1 membrane-binding protein [Hymenobacter nivis]
MPTLVSLFLRRTALGLLAAFALAGTAGAQTAAPAATGIIQEITNVVGLQPRFELRATREVDNAAAVVYGGKRYLLYNPDFLAAVNRAGRTNWAGISILAHEMGHHLNGHTLRTGGSNPQDELEADEFSGFVLRKLGASLAQAQAALAAVATDEGSASHPGRTPRLAAIGTGWRRAETQIAASRRGPAPSAAPVALAPARRSQADDADDKDDADATAAATPVRLVGQLTFRNHPDQPYYLTSGLNVVRVADDDTPVVVGHLTRTNSTDFPYVLMDGRQRRLFIAASGDVYDPQGQRVATLHE